MLRLRSPTAVHMVALAAVVSQTVGELFMTPQNIESKVGDTIYFNCSTNPKSWEIFLYHGNNYVYTGHGIFEPYQGRFYIHKNALIGSLDIVILSVETGDAGEYICIDDDGFGRRRSAELVVLDNDPHCQSNIQPDGVIGQNIFNITPDEFQLTCTVTYHGNIQPQLEWKTAGENGSLIKGTVTSNVTSTNRLTYTTKLTGDIVLDDTSYTCQTTRSIQNQSMCNSETIKVLYFPGGNKKEQNIVRGDIITCNISKHTFHCVNQWYHDNNTYGNDTITAIWPGEYTCFVKCHLRGINYVFEAHTTIVTEGIAPDPKITSAAVVVLPIILIILVALIVVFIAYKFHTRRTHITTEQTTQARDTMHVDSTKTSINTVSGEEASYVNFVRTAVAERHGRTITGIAILGDELFAVCKNYHEIEIFDARTVEFKPTKCVRLRMTTETLDDPYDIASCEYSSRLYIVDWRNNKAENRVYRIERGGDLSNFWDIDKIIGPLFLTHDGKIIVSSYRKNHFKIYSSEGECIDTVNLESETIRILHTIQLTSGQFVVSVQDEEGSKILFMDNSRTVKHQFSREGKQSSYYSYLAAGGDDVIALDFYNRDILLLASTGELKKQLNVGNHEIHPPSRVIWDAKSGRIFIVDNKVNFDGGIWIFKIS